MVSNEVEKINKLMKIAASIEEAFIVIMDTKTIKRIYRKKNDEPSQPVKKSFCESFNINLLQHIPEFK